MRLPFIRDRKREYDPISIDATDWFLRTKSGPMSPEDEVEFYAWLVENPKHKERFETANALWNVSEVLKDEPQAINSYDEILDGESAASMGKWFEKFTFHSPAFRFAVTAVVAFLLVAGIWLISSENYQSSIHQTQIGEQKKIYFSDGSMVILDTKTVIRTKFSESSRQIELKEGRASFSVAHNPKRPFIVTADQVVVRALGTEFNVHKVKRSLISVTITEGQVRINRSTDENELPYDKTQELRNPEQPAQNVFGPGQEVIIDENKEAHEIKSIDIKLANSWREGRLYFQNTPLYEVIDDINRYLEDNIIIRDNRLKKMVISLNYDIRRHEMFLPTLARVIPVAYHTAADGRIYLYKRNSDDHE